VPHPSLSLPSSLIFAPNPKSWFPGGLATVHLSPRPSRLTPLK
jgi:hypothetical protein